MTFFRVLITIMHQIDAGFAAGLPQVALIESYREWGF
jgi:hypothetical protein